MQKEVSMQFIHIADVHIGATPDALYPWGAMREKEIFQTFEKIILDCNEKEIDLLLIAGDLFHRQPLIRELKEVNYIFQKLNKTKVVLIAGNHDYIGVRSHYTDFSWNSNVYMLDNEEFDSIYFEDINTEVYGFSYHTRDILEDRLCNIAPGVEERINILLAHGGDERNMPFDKKRLSEAGFDYIALGHIHKPERITERMAYAGSPEPLDKTELGEHGYIIGEIIKKDFEVEIDSFTAAFISIASRQYKKLVIKINPGMTNGYVKEEIIKLIHEQGEKHIYRVLLTGFRDPDITFNAGEIVTVGNIVEIVDETMPDYDFDKLQIENANNIIGLYIDQIRNVTQDEDLKEKTLYFGIEALLKASTNFKK